MNPELQGRVFPPTAPYLVGREKVREFARAVFATNPINLDSDAARAAVTTARVNVEINLGGIKDAEVAARLRAALTGVDDVAARADAVTSAVRATIAPAS